MKQLRIGVDIDGVLADFNLPMMHAIIRVTGRDLFPRSTAGSWTFPCWDWPGHFGYTAAEMDRVWKDITSSDFWLHLPAFPGAPEALRLMKLASERGHTFYFPTNRPGVMSKRLTEGWLGQMGYPMATVLITSDKAGVAHTLKLTHYIDDNIENVQSTAMLTETYVRDQPWNAPDRPEWGRETPDVNHRITRTPDIGTFLIDVLSGLR